MRYEAKIQTCARLKREGRMEGFDLVRAEYRAKGLDRDAAWDAALAEFQPLEGGEVVVRAVMGADGRWVSALDGSPAEVVWKSSRRSGGDVGGKAGGCRVSNRRGKALPGKVREALKGALEAGESEGVHGVRTELPDGKVMDSEEGLYGLVEGGRKGVRLDRRPLYGEGAAEVGAGELAVLAEKARGKGVRWGELLEWVGSHMNATDLRPTDAPHALAWNLLMWARSSQGSQSEFWRASIALGKGRADRESAEEEAELANLEEVIERVRSAGAEAVQGEAVDRVSRAELG